MKGYSNYYLQEIAIFLIILDWLDTIFYYIGCYYFYL